MTSPLDDDLPTDPHEGLDATDNVEARDREQAQTPELSRAGGESVADTPAPAAGEAPDVAGTGAGDALSGVTIDPDDAAEAVPGDEGPEHGGVRRSS